MIPPALAHLLLSLIVGISILLMLIRPCNIPEVYWIGGGVLLLVILRLLPLPLVGRGVASALDVCLFLIGMMLLSELAREHGVFDWLSSLAVRTANGSCSRLFAMVYAVGTMVTIFMSNDATAVVLTPAILTVVRKAKVEPLPYLFVCAFIANAASFLLPISNPANLVVFHNQMPRLNRWLLAYGVPCLLSIAATFIVMRWLFRTELGAAIESEVEDKPLTSDGKLVLGGLAITVIVLLTASSLGKDLGLPTCLAALAITVAVSIKARSNPLGLAREISWGTFVLVAGLFVMVDAIERAGAMQRTQEWLAWAQTLGSTPGTLITGFAVGVANNLVNNLPLGLIAGSTLQGDARKRSDCRCRPHRRRSGAEPVNYGVIGDDLVADRLAQRKARCELLGFSQGRRHSHACQSAGGARRGNFDANVLSDCLVLSPQRNDAGGSRQSTLGVTCTPNRRVRIKMAGAT